MGINFQIEKRIPAMSSKSPRKSTKSPRKSSASKGKKRRSRSKSSRKSSGIKKHTYVEMIQIGLLTLNEKGGSTRQELWKCVHAKFPEADYKIFLVRLKKYSS